MCIVKCIFSDQIIFMVHIPFKDIIEIFFQESGRWRTNSRWRESLYPWWKEEDRQED